VRRALIAGAAALFLTVPSAAQAFSPNDPYVPRQWYLTEDKAFDAFADLPILPLVKVAVIDSGIDKTHPELLKRVVASRSFVGGTANDDDGHGTFVAGEIAAAVDNGRGIAGLAPSARLVVAKVVRDDGSVSTWAEAHAIRWAVREGARVINISLGGIRDPGDPNHSGYSWVEQRAVDYATSHGALVVAAVGNSQGAPIKPWRHASYPAALDHVLGVASYGHSGNVPSFSNRDDVYVDLATPGEDIFSLLPKAITEKNPDCVEQGYSSCGPKEFRRGAGTSFSAPQAAAAAATLFSLRPRLTPDQVSTLLERTATDATPATGCDTCSVGRDALTGFGELDVAAAIQRLRLGPVPKRDRLEPNDDVGYAAAPITGRKVRFRATIDTWDDPTDVYRVKLQRGHRISVRVPPSSNVDVSIVLWKPETHSLATATDSQRAARSVHPPGMPEKMHYVAPESGWYFVQVKLAKPGSGSYKIKIRHS
jgi:subtilisin family serine protease